MRTGHLASSRLRPPHLVSNRFRDLRLRSQGPGILYVLARAIFASGRRAGWYAAMGFHLAGFGHSAAVAFGVTTLLKMIPALFVIMKVF